LVVKDLKYVDSYEWVKVDGNSATIGIIVGVVVTQGGSFGATESVKTTSDINSSITRKVVEVNKMLDKFFALLNGWIIKVEISDSGELNN
ncbi:Glycine cleavage system H protein 2, mitochondrial, partial [Glycine soja]